MATAQKARALTKASASGGGACCSLPTETAPSKRRRHLPLTTGFQIEENTLNDFRIVASWNITTFFQSLMEQRSGFHRILVQYFVHKEECLSWFYSTKTIKLLSIYSKAKSQGNFYKYVCLCVHEFISMWVYKLGNSYGVVAFRRWGNKKKKCR